MAVEGIGWLLVVAGVAMLVLPGPGLLGLAAGLAVLSPHRPWAARRLEPVKVRAIQAAHTGVKTWPRILASLAGCAWVLGVGVLWMVQPPAPGWWPVSDTWWLFGGWATGVTMLLSGAIALALLVYSIRAYRGRPLDAALSSESRAAPSADGLPPGAASA